jgi:hypothetical protein
MKRLREIDRNFALYSDLKTGPIQKFQTFGLRQANWAESFMPKFGFQFSFFVQIWGEFFNL